MNRKAFTVMEIVIGSAILIMFMGGLLTLFSSGNKMSNSAMWLQSISNQLKNTARQINTSLRKSSYPSKVEFPQRITLCESDCFKVHFADRELKVSDPNSVSKSGTVFLRITESTPAKEGFATNQNQNASQTYHIFTIYNDGNLNYSKYEETVQASNITESYEKSSLTDGAKKVFSTILTKNVESIHCSKVNAESNYKHQSLKVVINCKIPNGVTTRSEEAIGTPNVELIGDLL